MIIHGWKFEKKKVDCSKRPSEKEKKIKEKGLEKKIKKKKNRSAI